MHTTINVKKGLDIKLNGAAEINIEREIVPLSCAIVPEDFPGITPKVDVKEGDVIVMGATLYHDKTFPDIKVTSPISGTITTVQRGERRRLERIVIIPESGDEIVFDHKNIDDRTRAQQLLLDSGLWAYMRQRPNNIVPRPGVTPRDIFITGFDSAPLAPDYEPTLAGKLDELNAAVKLLQRLTDGHIYIGIRNGSILEQVNGADIVVVDGPHPAGNVGIQICNISPVNKGDVVWTMDAITLLRIGHLATTGKLDMSAKIALTGCEVSNPHYIKTIVGCDIASLVKGEIKNDGVHHRIISGNVLTGSPVSETDYLRFPYTQISVIPEGDDNAEFMGWASMSPKKMSISPSFPGHFSKRNFCPDARILGGRRAMIMSCVYDKVLPMDILPEYLIKAILSRNLERMEELGIYEVAPEDFALCEFVDPSKLELQKIVQEGLDYIQKELN